jgi:hypothetical protein
LLPDPVQLRSVDRFLRAASVFGHLMFLHGFFGTKWIGCRFKLDSSMSFVVHCEWKEEISPQAAHSRI